MKEDTVQQSAEHALEYQLNVMRKDEFEVYIDNEKTTLDDALERCVRECSVYMDSRSLWGNVTHLRPDLITCLHAVGLQV